MTIINHEKSQVMKQLQGTLKLNNPSNSTKHHSLGCQDPWVCAGMRRPSCIMTSKNWTWRWRLLRAAGLIIYNSFPFWSPGDTVPCGPMLAPRSSTAPSDLALLASWTALVRHSADAFGHEAMAGGGDGWVAMDGLMHLWLVAMVDTYGQNAEWWFYWLIWGLVAMNDGW